MTESRCQKCGELLIGRKLGAKYCYVCSDKINTDRVNARRKLKKLFILVLGGILYATVSIHPVRADSATRRELLTLSKKVKADDARREALKQRSARVETIKRVLANAKSPMVNDAETFIAASEQYGVDYKLLLGICRHESGFGKATPYYGQPSYNCFGWSNNVPGNRFRTFHSWSDGILTVAKGLAGPLYKGKSIEEIIAIYCPKGDGKNDPTAYASELLDFISNI